MRINFISSLDNDEFHTIHTKSNSVKITNDTETNDIINELFESFFRRYQKKKLETKMKGSAFVFDSVDLLYYKLHKIILNRGGPYIKNSPEWLKNKKATINPKTKDKDNECFRYAIAVALNHEKIEKKPHKEYQKLGLLLLIIIGKTLNFNLTQKIIKNLNKTIISLICTI